VYAANVRACDGEQMVMIGYSDSNKDCGYLAASWALYRAQESIAQVCDAHHVALTLFHGRGGSVARGGGPAARHRARTLPRHRAGRDDRLTLCRSRSCPPTPRADRERRAPGLGGYPG